MLTLTRLLVVAALTLIASVGAAGAQTITVSGNPALLRISSAVAGSDPTSVTNAVTTYTVVTGTANKTYAISMQLDANMPTGVTLTATLATTTGATSLGAVALDVTARQVITGIKKNTNATRAITYSLSATAAAGVIPNTSRTVTLTIAQFP